MQGLASGAGWRYFGNRFGGGRCIGVDRALLGQEGSMRLGHSSVAVDIDELSVAVGNNAQDVTRGGVLGIHENSVLLGGAGSSIGGDGLAGDLQAKM